MESVVDFFNYLFESLEHLGVWAYWAILLVAFLDSLIVTGTFMNGAAFLLLAGVLVSRGTYDFTDMVIFAGLGAIAGGFLSYFIGRIGASFVLRRKHSVREGHVNFGNKIVERYGGFGIFIGRFLGPTSSIVAFLAGSMRMSPRNFVFWNILAGVTWGIFFITLGSSAGGYFI